MATGSCLVIDLTFGNDCELWQDYLDVLGPAKTFSNKLDLFGNLRISANEAVFGGLCIAAAGPHLVLHAV